MMKNYKKSLLIAALAAGSVSFVNAQSAKFSLNGMGRSILTNSGIDGEFVGTDATVQTSGTSGYNLFDLQTNLAVDSSFQAMAVFRARSPFGSFFGARTGFEFRQFKMHGKVQDFRYEIGDIRVEMTPFTVWNSEIIDNTYESEIFAQRRAIQEYENFNKGNSWLLQGLNGQYFFKINDDGMGIGAYAFTTRNTSTNEATVPDRLLSGGRLEFRANNQLKFGANAVTLYDISTLRADYDYVTTAWTWDGNFVYNNDVVLIDAKAEGGISLYDFNVFVDNGANLVRSNVNYTDGFVSGDFGIGFKEPKLRVDLNARSVGVLYTAPAAQSRRINPDVNPSMFTDGVAGQVRGATLFDRSTSEEMYNNTINPTLGLYNYAYNRATPFGKATPNRTGGTFRFGTDTANHKVDLSSSFAYLWEVQGEGVQEVRNFMVATGGAVLHIDKLADFSRALRVNVGGRYETTTRGGLAPVNYASLLVDAGVSFELLKKIDLLAGMKYIQAEGNEYYGSLDGFNLLTDFTAIDESYGETIISGGARIRFTPFQTFVVNYNMSNYVLTDNLTAGRTAYNLNQLFFSYIGRF